MAPDNGRGATKSQHKDYARSLFLTVDGEGKKKYSGGEIASILNKELGTKYHRSTINRWAVRGGWDNEFRQMIQYGVENTREPDREVMDKKAKDVKELYEVAKGFSVESSSQLWERLKEKQLSNKELIMLKKQMDEIMLQLNPTRSTQEMEEYMKVNFTTDDIKQIEGEIYYGRRHRYSEE